MPTNPSKQKQGYNAYSKNRIHIVEDDPKLPPQPVIHQEIRIVVTHCSMCHQMTKSYVKRRIGGITWVWFFLLLFTTGILCWIPLVIDKFKDQEIICVQCNTKKVTL